MAEKFTPGEWHIEDFDSWEIAGKFVVGEDNEPIAKVYNQYNKIPDFGSLYRLKESKERMQANAALLAAAPQMYECVCDALTDLEMPEGMRNHFESVLKKARGEE